MESAHRVLSQEEIDALFSIMSPESPNAGEKPDAETAERIFELMKPVPMALSCELRNASITMEDLLKVSVGDILDLDERGGEPVYLCVGGIARFFGRMVQRRGKKAFEISGILPA